MAGSAATAPSLGLVRAEPDGSVVIAGSAEPGATVEILSNGKTLGTTVAEPSGDWVFVPEERLPTGGVEITAITPDNGLRTAESVVIGIQEDRSSEPLVVASKPGEASEILQGLSRPGVSATDMPSAEPVTEAAAEPDAGTDPVLATEAPAAQLRSAEQPSETAVAEAQPEQAAGEAVDVAEAINSAAADNESARLAEAPDVQVGAGSAPEGTSTPAVAEPATSEVADTAGTVDSINAAAADNESAQLTEAPSVEVLSTGDAVDVAAADTADMRAEAPVTAVVAPTIDAIEVETDRNFFAGSGQDDATVRLYVDDEFVADARVNDGRWLVETGPVLDKPSQRVRVDMLRPGSSDVVARAEVDFVIDLPEQQVADVAADSINAAGEQNNSEQLAEPPAVETGAAMETPAVEVPAPSSEQPAAAEVPVNGEAVASGESAAPATGAQQVETPEVREEPATAAGSRIAEVPAAEDEVPVLEAVPVGDPRDQRFASGKAIIRRGDNLWSIARRVYGEGIRYTIIYEANTDQIRDPDLIYPGQVFALPGNGE